MHTDVSCSIRRLNPDDAQIWAFKTWGVEPRSLRHAGRYTDDIHMILDLRESQGT